MVEELDEDLDLLKSLEIIIDFEEPSIMVRAVKGNSSFSIKRILEKSTH